MHAVPPEGPLHSDDRDREPSRLEEPPAESAAARGARRDRAWIPTFLLIAAVVLIVALILLL
jgi:hypothetical protein